MRLWIASAVMWIVAIGAGVAVLNDSDVLSDNHKESIYYVIAPGHGGGTGFAVKTGLGYTAIVTNAHVCRASKDGKVQLHQDDLFVPVDSEIISADEAHDICLVKAPHNAKPMELAKVDPKLGERIWIAGHPKLTPFVVTTGLIEGRMTVEINEGDASDCPNAPNFRKVDGGLFGEMCLGTFNAFESNAPSKPGSSGSPVLNQAGEVVGVLFAGGEDDSLILPLENLNYVLDMY